MPQLVTIESLPDAFAMLKAMESENSEWLHDYRPAAREALIVQLETAMAGRIDRHLERIAEQGKADRRNGSYRRSLLTELGFIELEIPRTRQFSAIGVIRRYARRAGHLDRMILACFVLGLSTRKVATALLPVLGRPVSASTVSEVSKQLDAAVAAFHCRPLKNRYHALLLDGVVLRHKTGAGALSRPVLVALGIRADGRKEIIDYRLAGAESAEQWERFLTGLYKRGLTGDGLDLIGVDGGAGLLAALPTVYPDVPVQRCWAHKIRNIVNKVRCADEAAVKVALHIIMNASTEMAARSAARAFADRWQDVYPKAVDCFRRDLDDLLTCWMYDDPAMRKRTRTTNAIERRFREVRRRTRPMGVFQNKTSLDRILFAVFINENKTQRIPSLLDLTHNS